MSVSVLCVNYEVVRTWPCIFSVQDCGVRLPLPLIMQVSVFIDNTVLPNVDRDCYVSWWESSHSGRKRGVKQIIGENMAGVLRHLKVTCAFVQGIPPSRL